ncbi:VanZ family protein [Streptomyces sp. NBC_00045]|uniref:VanZ family protein n=1 Tax=Streptomyces sp. NBC_00045 TaxID=2975625 RepID=UPI0032484D8F
MTWRSSRRSAEKRTEQESAERKPAERKPTERTPAERALPAARSRHRRPAHPAVRASAMVTAFAGTVLFGVVLARLTLEPSAASAALVHANVRPGRSISAYLEGTSTIAAVHQLGGNLLLGLPFGVLLPVLLPPARGLLRVGAVTACLMTLVELVQGALVTGRVFDVDDVILNTAGALLGYLLLGRRLGRAVHPRRRHWWTRRAAEPRDTRSVPRDS